MTTKDTLNDAIESAIKVAQAFNEASLVHMPFLKVDDLTWLAEPYLTQASKDALLRKAKVLELTELGVAYKAIYMASIWRMSSTEKGIQHMAEQLNSLTELGLVHSVLAPISSIELAFSPSNGPSQVVICYPLVPVDRMEEVEALVKHVKDEDIALPAEDLSFALKEGQFIANININHLHPSLALGREAVLEIEINQYLSILPKGTTVVEKIPCSITGLSLPYMVIFHNPIMKEFKEVRLEHFRAAISINDRVEQFNLIKSVTYIRHDGTTV